MTAAALARIAETLSEVGSRNTFSARRSRPPDALRLECDAGRRPGLTTQERARLKELDPSLHWQNSTNRVSGKPGAIQLLVAAGLNSLRGR